MSIFNLFKRKPKQEQKKPEEAKAVELVEFDSSLFSELLKSAHWSQIVKILEHKKDLLARENIMGELKADKMIFNKGKYMGLNELLVFAEGFKAHQRQEAERAERAGMLGKAEAPAPVSYFAD